jgi:parvulin-like peptidyl-prolyl isomerase
MSDSPSRTLLLIRTALAQRPQRTLVLPALAAVAGMVIAGLSTFRPAPQILTVPAGYIALVNQKGILTSDFMVQTAAVTGRSFAETSAAERNKTLHDMIDEELLVQRGMSLDLPETTTEVRDVMTAAVNAQVDVATKAQPPTEAELKAFYDAHRSDYSSVGTMQVRDLLLRIGGYQNADQSTAQAETDASEALYQLRSGVAVDHVMLHFGFVDSGRADAGEVLDFAAKLHLGLKLFQAAGALSDGEISEPIVEVDGVHLLLMRHRRPPRVADFAGVRPKVYSDYTESAAKRAQEEELKILRRDAQILVAPVKLVAPPAP